MTKAQIKWNARIEAWQKGEPFKENSRDKNPRVPELTAQEVLDNYTPRYATEQGAFYTPLEMGVSVLERLGGSSMLAGARLLDPCAGIGHLLYALPTGLTIDAYEADEAAVQLGRRLFPWVNWTHDEPFGHVAAIEGQYDYVLMNPPFGTSWAMAEGERMCAGRCKLSEHIFLELAIRALKPGGTAAVIGPYNFVDKLPKAARAWMEENARLDDSFGPLPGKFALTSTRVHAFYFSRVWVELEPEAPIPVEFPKRALAEEWSGNQLALW